MGPHASAHCCSSQAQRELCRRAPAGQPGLPDAATEGGLQDEDRAPRTFSCRSVSRWRSHCRASALCCPLPLPCAFKAASAAAPASARSPTAPSAATYEAITAGSLPSSPALACWSATQACSHTSQRRAVQRRGDYPACRPRTSVCILQSAKAQLATPQAERMLAGSCLHMAAAILGCSKSPPEPPAAPAPAVLTCPHGCACLPPAFGHLDCPIYAPDSKPQLLTPALEVCRPPGLCLRPNPGLGQVREPAGHPARVP